MFARTLSVKIDHDISCYPIEESLDVGDLFSGRDMVPRPNELLRRDVFRLFSRTYPKIAKLVDFLGEFRVYTGEFSLFDVHKSRRMLICFLTVISVYSKACVPLEATLTGLFPHNHIIPWIILLLTGCVLCISTPTPTIPCWTG